MKRLKKRLIELLASAENKGCDICNHDDDCLVCPEAGAEFCGKGIVADHLIANGVVDLSHVMLLEVEEDYGPFQVPKVVLYNENHVTQEEALRIVRAGEYHPSVLTLPKRQWETLFLNRKGD